MKMTCFQPEGPPWSTRSFFGVSSCASLALPDVLQVSGGCPKTVEPKRGAETWDVLRTAWPRLYAFSRRVTGNAEDARDILQEVFLAFNARTDGWASADHLTAWLLRVTGHTCLDHMRRASRWNLLWRGLGDRTFAADGRGELPSTSPEEHLMMEMDQTRLERVLGGLRPVERLGLELFHEGVDYSGIAQALGVSRRSVGTLLYRTRQKILCGMREEDAP